MIINVKVTSRAIEGRTIFDNIFLHKGPCYSATSEANLKNRNEGTDLEESIGQ